jgi:hypothetical protein
MRPTILIAISALTLGAPQLATAQAKAHPDFTGTWVMDTARTPRAGMATTALSYTVKQTPTMLTMDRKVETAQGSAGGTLNYNLDGSPTPNHVSQGGQELSASSTMTWAADTLVLSSDITAGERTVHQVDRWVLAPGGKELTISRRIDMGGQVREASYVMTKQ